VFTVAIVVFTVGIVVVFTVGIVVVLTVGIVVVFTVIWFSGFRGEDLNVIFYQHMPKLHNRYISAERKISQKNPELYFKPESAQI
jgi:hypothetical protein